MCRKPMLIWWVTVNLVSLSFALQTPSFCDEAKTPKTMEWRQFPVPYGTPETGRPPDEEFLKLLPPLRPEPEFDKKSNDLGFAAWWGDYSEQLFSEQPPAKVDLKKNPLVVTPAGEDEPVVLGLWGLRDVGAVLLNVKKSPFPVVIRHVEFGPRWVPEDYYNDSVEGSRKVGFAMYLPEQGTGQVETGENMVFWINVAVPCGTKPGRYTVDLQLTVHEIQKVFDLPLTVEVLDFVLPKSDIAYGMYFRPFAPHLPERYCTPKLMQTYWNDMARHGMTSAALYNYAGTIHDADGNPKFDGNPDMETLKNMMKEGLVHPDVPIMFLGGIDSRAAGAVRGELKKQGFPEFLVYGPDEPAVNDQSLANFQRLQPLRKDFRIVTAIGDHAATVYADLFDIWVIHGGLLTPEVRQLAAKKGAEVWTYDCHHRGMGNAPWSRYYAGLYTWALGLKGNFLWCYTENYSWEGDRGAIFCYVLPSDNGPVPSVEWEARREGVEDYRTLKLLESLIAIRPGSAEAEEARGWLEGIKGRVDWYLARNMPPSMYPWDGPQLYPMCPNFNQTELSGIRTKAQDYIEKLTR